MAAPPARGAVRHAYAERPLWQADVERRRLERWRLAATHHLIYASVTQ